MEITQSQWDSLTTDQRAGIAALGIKVVPDAKKKAPARKKDYFAKREEEALKAKEYNLQVHVTCALCRGEHDQYYEMRRSPNNAQVLQSSRVDCPDWKPDMIKETTLRSCYQCKTRLEKLGAAKLTLLATRLSNHVVERDATTRLVNEAGIYEND